MKKFHLAFGLTALAAAVIGLVHGGVAWAIAESSWSPTATSFPTWVAFMLPLLFYGLIVLAILLVWLLTWLIVCGIRKKHLAKSREM